MRKERGFKHLISAALGGAVLIGSPAQAVNINNPFLDAYYGGQLGNYYDSANTMPSVAALFMNYNGGFGEWCTGTLINSRTILTAAHCVVEDQAQAKLFPQIGSLQIRFSPNPASSSTSYDRKIRDVIFHQGYAGNDDLDIALISLDRPIHGLQPVKLAPAGYMVSMEELATIVGYGLAGSGTNPGRPDDNTPRLPNYNDAKRRIAVTQIGEIDGNIIHAQFRIPGSPDNPNQYHLQQPVPELQGQPEGGDSGGPLFIQTPAGWLQIGTVMRGGAGLYGDSGYASIDDWTWLPFYASWLQTNIATLLSSTVAQPKAGGGGPVRWSDASAWSTNKSPENLSGHLDSSSGGWDEGTYYEVDVNAPVNLIVDRNVDIDALTVNHKSAVVGIQKGNLLYTTLDTTVADGELNVNGQLDADALLLQGGRLSGSGLLTLAWGLTQTGGVIAPGNSPGTLTVDGSVALGSGARYETDIDGTGTGNGAGNHDRLLVTGAYLAGGELAPILRGISGSASNTYSPPLGQGYEVVNAVQGVSGSYASLAQPAAGLLPGTRFDTVYGGNAITLYVTPASYANLGAAGVDDNYNRRRLGAALDGLRPAAGVRPGDAQVKSLYDGLAPQTVDSLPRAMDQLGGVGYAQLIQAGFENSKFIIDQTEQVLAAQRRGDPLLPISTRPKNSAGSRDAKADPDKLVWGTAFGRISSQKADSDGYKTSNTLGGLIGGVQKRLETGTTVGYSLAYAYSSPDVKPDMAHGSTDNVQIMAYANRNFESGYFLQGTAGAGAGRIRASRNVSLAASGQWTTIQSINGAASGLIGWARGKPDEPRVEFTLGMRYVAQQYRGFGDNNDQVVGALDVERGTLQSFTASLGAAASLPFRAGTMDWRASAWTGLSHEFADTRATIDARLLNASYDQRSGAIGRDKLSAGLALSGKVTQRTAVTANIAGELARNWRAASIGLGVQVAF